MTKRKPSISLTKEDIGAIILCVLFTMGTMGKRGDLSASFERDLKRILQALEVLEKSFEVVQ